MKERMEEIKRTKRKEKQQCMCVTGMCVFSTGPCFPGEEGTLQVHERQAEPHQEQDSNL